MSIITTPYTETPHERDVNYSDFLQMCYTRPQIRDRVVDIVKEEIEYVINNARGYDYSEVY